jgi:hypothetical protein
MIKPRYGSWVYEDVQRRTDAVRRALSHVGKLRRVLITKKCAFITLDFLADATAVVHMNGQVLQGISTQPVTIDYGNPKVSAPISPLTSAHNGLCRKQLCSFSHSNKTNSASKVLRRRSRNDTECSFRRQPTTTTTIVTAHATTRERRRKSSFKVSDANSSNSVCLNRSFLKCY